MDMAVLVVGHMPGPEGRAVGPEGRAVCPEGMAVCPEGMHIHMAVGPEGRPGVVPGQDTPAAWDRQLQRLVSGRGTHSVG